MAADLLMEEQNVSAFLDLKATLQENSVVPLKILVTPHLVAQTPNVRH